jgi:hypothetical protein
MSLPITHLTPPDDLNQPAAPPSKQPKLTLGPVSSEPGVLPLSPTSPAYPASLAEMAYPAWLDVVPDLYSPIDYHKVGRLVS